MPNIIAAGNLTRRPLNGYADEVAILEPGLGSRQYVGYGKITTTPQSEIELVLPSFQKRRADIPFIVPASTVYRMSIRLPRFLREDEKGLGKKYGLLENGATLIGTTGERLKVATIAAGHTATSPVIVSASNSYTPNGSVVIGATEWGTLAAPLGTLASPTTFKLYVSNAGNTAAGNGISVSKGVAYILAEVCCKILLDAVELEQSGYPLAPDEA
jgi:hypothetical protein